MSVEAEAHSAEAEAHSAEAEAEGGDLRHGLDRANRAARVGQGRAAAVRRGFISFIVKSRLRRAGLTPVKRQIGECRATLPALSYNLILH